MRIGHTKYKFRWRRLILSKLVIKFSTIHVESNSDYGAISFGNFGAEFELSNIYLIAFQLNEKWYK